MFVFPPDLFLLLAGRSIKPQCGILRIIAFPIVDIFVFVYYNSCVIESCFFGNENNVRLIFTQVKYERV